MIVNGFHWPDRDIHCRSVVFDMTKDLEKALNLCDETKVCVQAGGNCGVWPAHLAEQFEMVVTFEPDSENFRCLVQNVPENVVTIQGCVGFDRGMVDLKGKPDNCGAYYVDGDGPIPVFRIDDLGLPACDLIVLDVEGMEAAALEGARETIREYRPVLMYEDKGLSQKYGVQKGELEERMSAFGYTVAHRIHRDVILVA